MYIYRYFHCQRVENRNLYARSDQGINIDRATLESNVCVRVYLLLDLRSYSSA